MSYSEYFRLKQLEFLRHDGEAARIMDRFHTIGLDRYRPESYVLFHTLQHKTSLYYIYSIMM
jgi:hypothetical protein